MGSNINPGLGQSQVERESGVGERERIKEERRGGQRETSEGQKEAETVRPW